MTKRSGGGVRSAPRRTGPPVDLSQTQTQFFDLPAELLPFRTHLGGELAAVTLAYETFGELNEARDNAVLVFHALTGSQHLAGWTPDVPGVAGWNDECRRGWWSDFVGPGLAIDTDELFVVSANYLGGCYGTTGPSSIDPATGEPYGSSFPDVRFVDVVDSQMALLDHLGIDRLRAVTGASTGGLAALVLATRYPDRVATVVPIATGLRTTELQFLHNFEQTVAILNDPEFNGGDYYGGPHPDRGLTLARMIGHKTFVSLDAMSERARSQVDASWGSPEGYDLGHPLESYIWASGRRFLERFDANTYLRLMWMWQHFDLLAEVGGDHDSLVDLFDECTDQRYLVFSIDSDVCFYPDAQTELMRVLKGAGIEAMRITVHSEKGHDSFLLEPELFAPHLRQALS
jgi:homoserine O-acetyltransferase